MVCQMSFLRLESLGFSKIRIQNNPFFEKILRIYLFGKQDFLNVFQEKTFFIYKREVIRTNLLRLDLNQRPDG